MAFWKHIRKSQATNFEILQLIFFSRKSRFLRMKKNYTIGSLSSLAHKEYLCKSFLASE